MEFRERATCNPKKICAGYAQPVLLDPSSFSNLDYYGKHEHCLLRKRWNTHRNKTSLSISNDSGATRTPQSTTQTMEVYRTQCIAKNSWTTPVRVSPLEFRERATCNPKKICAGYAQPVLLDPSSFSNLDYYGKHEHCLLRKRWNTHRNKTSLSISNDSGATRTPQSTTQTMEVYRIQCISNDYGATRAPQSTTQTMEKNSMRFHSFWGHPRSPKHNRN